MKKCLQRIGGWLISSFLLSVIVLGVTAAAEKSTAESIKKSEIPKGKIDRELASIAYSGGEFFKYDISWTGGIKIGELHLALKTSEEGDDYFEIDATITTSGGMVHALYPVRDRHITKVRGAERLPYFAEIWQKQGRRYTAHKQISYDQENHTIVKIKDGDAQRHFQLDGEVYNEFASFFSSRVMDLRVGFPIIVPTFGDDKRNEVVVVTLEKTHLKDTLLGDVETLKVSPILTFSGLYDKRGDTVIWYTNDECRVPVLIQSKIVIGSLTASLAEYRNPLCDRYKKFMKDSIYKAKEKK
jgi:hypothetical protein